MLALVSKQKLTSRFLQILILIQTQFMHCFFAFLIVVVDILFQYEIENLVSSKSTKNLDMHMMKSAAMDGDKIAEADIGSVHKASLVEHAVEKDENHDHIQRMEPMIEKILKIQQKMSDHLNLRLDFVYKKLTGKFEALDAHAMMLDTHVSQTAGVIKMQEALVKGKAVESERHQVGVILNNDFGEVVEHENQLTSSDEHLSTLSVGHRSTPYEEYVGTVRIQRHSEFSA